MIDPFEIRKPAISYELAEELKQYKGLWVAIHDGHVIASSDSIMQVNERASEMGIEHPLLHHVPNHAERLAIL